MGGVGGVVLGGHCVAGLLGGKSLIACVVVGGKRWVYVIGVIVWSGEEIFGSGLVFGVQFFEICGQKFASVTVDLYIVEVRGIIEIKVSSILFGA